MERNIRKELFENCVRIIQLESKINTERQAEVYKKDSDWIEILQNFEPSKIHDDFIDAIKGVNDRSEDEFDLIKGDVFFGLVGIKAQQQLLPQLPLS